MKLKKVWLIFLRGGGTGYALKFATGYLYTVKRAEKTALNTDMILYQTAYSISLPFQSQRSFSHNGVIPQKSLLEGERIWSIILSSMSATLYHTALFLHLRKYLENTQQGRISLRWRVCKIAAPSHTILMGKTPQNTHYLL